MGGGGERKRDRKGERERERERESFHYVISHACLGDQQNTLDERSESSSVVDILQCTVRLDGSLSSVRGLVLVSTKPFLWLFLDVQHACRSIKTSLSISQLISQPINLSQSFSSTVTDSQQLNVERRN